jgi:hypothetical protein
VALSAVAPSSTVTIFSSTEVLVGWLDLGNDSEGTRYDVRSIDMYSGYNRNTPDGDICKLALSTYVPSPSLDTSKAHIAGVAMAVAGWGWGNTDAFGSSFPEKLRARRMWMCHTY